MGGSPGFTPWPSLSAPRNSAAASAPAPDAMRDLSTASPPPRTGASPKTIANGSTHSDETVGRPDQADPARSSVPDWYSTSTSRNRTSDRQRFSSRVPGGSGAADVAGRGGEGAGRGDRRERRKAWGRVPAEPARHGRTVSLHRIFGAPGVLALLQVRTNLNSGRPQDVVAFGGIVRPSGCACARRRQGASLRSAPASRGSRP